MDHSLHQCWRRNAVDGELNGGKHELVVTKFPAAFLPPGVSSPPWMPAWQGGYARGGSVSVHVPFRWMSIPRFGEPDGRRGGAGKV
jgi:hypothetical protein